MRSVFDRWFVSVALLFGAGCVTQPAEMKTPAGTCELSSTGVLRLQGTIDDRMHACVEALSIQHLHRVELDSPGGNVRVAMRIGDMLARFQTDMVVKNECSSSCANYILPVARRITVEAGALVILHGSIDEVWREQGSADLVELQAEYAARHSFRQGWLLVRDPANPAGGPSMKYVSGAPETWGQPASVAYLIAEEAFLISCLPGVSIDPFVDTEVQRIGGDGALREKYTRRKMYPTGSMRCLT
jgi:hypothetical protein